MQSVKLIRCGSNSRMDRLLDRLELSEAADSRCLLFAISVDRYGPGEEYISLLRRVRSGDWTGFLAAVIVVGETELDTKAVGRELIFHLNRAGCAFPERPLVEATGSMHNLRIVQKNLALFSPEDALLAAAKSLLERLQGFSSPRFDVPRLLVLHASDHATSNTLCLGDMVLGALSARFRVRTLSLRNGTIEDCRGCSFKVCSHFANKGSCFYGGSIAQEVLPAVRDCDALLLLLPNYNDSVGANIMAFINRLTSLHVNNELSGRRLYAIVVSGYSGGELVATQAMGALCLNKSFLLPPGFCMLETSNDPGEILRQPGISDRAAAFARQMEQEMLSAPATGEMPTDHESAEKNRQGGNHMIRLETITPENWRSGLHVGEDQRKYVADSAGILARAWAYRDYRSRAFLICDGDTPVGMAMYHDDVEETDAFVFDQFFIDARYQGRGFGLEAARLLLGRMEADKSRKKVYLCYIEGDTAAKNLYEKLGFHETGQVEEDEIIMEKLLR